MQEESIADAVTEHSGNGEIKSNTEQWYKEIARKSNGLTELYFLNEPEVKSAHPSDRILVLSTYNEREDMKYFVDQFADRFSKVDYCNQTSFFWEKFFGKKDFLDGLEGRTTPSLMLSTGKMNNFGKLGRDIYNAETKHRRIAEKWDIPLYMIT